MITRKIDAATVRDLLDYDPATGEFTWRHGCGNRLNGQRAGSTAIHGYRRIKIGGFPYQAHRLAWIYVHGDIPVGMLIDHVNGDTLDNRLSNLRIASSSQNIANSKVRRDSRSGVKGVYWAPRQRRWKALIRQDGRQHHLGYFKKIEEAQDAYARAAERLFGSFARVG